MPAPVFVAGILFARVTHGRSDIEGEQDGAKGSAEQEAGVAQPQEQAEREQEGPHMKPSPAARSVSRRPPVPSGRCPGTTWQRCRTPTAWRTCRSSADTAPETRFMERFMENPPNLATV